MPSILLITNDFGPRAGGIETFVIGLLERIPAGEVIVYTSYQDECTDYDAKWWHDYRVEVIRDKSKILLPTPRVIRSLQKLIRERGIKKVWFGAAAPLAFNPLVVGSIPTSGIKHIAGRSGRPGRSHKPY